MPGTTPTYALRYPLSTDPPDGPAQILAALQDVETQLTRLDDLVALLADATDWAAYTPSVQNLGSGAFSTQTGWWCRPFHKLVLYTVYLVVSTNGTGTTNVGYKLPTIPYRAGGSGRQVVGTGTRGDGTRVKQLVPILFGGGTAEWIDRIVQDGSTSYIQGQDLDAGDIYTFTGHYRED